MNTSPNGRLWGVKRVHSLRMPRLALSWTVRCDTRYYGIDIFLGDGHGETAATTERGYKREYTIADLYASCELSTTRRGHGKLTGARSQQSRLARQKTHVKQTPLLQHVIVYGCKGDCGGCVTWLGEWWWSRHRSAGMTRRGTLASETGSGSSDPSRTCTATATCCLTSDCLSHTSILFFYFHRRWCC